MAGRAGFEPASPCGLSVFKTEAFSRSAISPSIHYSRERRARRSAGASVPTYFSIGAPTMLPYSVQEPS